jgi:FAD/FMN-containing dehydrogenase
MRLVPRIARHKKLFTLAGIVIIVGVLGIRKGIQFAAAPTREKDCDFIYPPADPGKPTTITLEPQAAPFEFIQFGGTINDASCLNKTSVYGVAQIASIDDVRNALQYAKDHGLKVTPAGERHSMGGHSFAQGALVMDMRNYNKMHLNREEQTLTVESGAKWADIQKYLDKEGFSVKAMQSINIFTVGGTLSVNAHGVAHDPGQIAPTVKSMRIMTPAGHVVTASPTMNSELFSHALGGYGLFGVILDVKLEIVPNEVYRWSTTYMDYTEFPTFFKNNVDKNPEHGLMYGRISLSPGKFLEETAVHTFEKTEWSEPLPELIFPKLTWLNRLVINFSKTGSVGRWLRWTLEKNVEHRIHTCVSRNEAMSQNEVCDVSRNQEMYDAMGYLKNKLRDTDILQEYFIPAEHMTQFIDGLRDTVKKNNANLLNVTIRIVHDDKITALPYAKGDRFAFVLYFNQKLNEKEAKILEQTTVDLIDVAIKAGGTFYLPYQLYYSPEQLRTAYPEVDSFFAKKKAYDPEEVFVNSWYNKYSKL